MQSVESEEVMGEEIGKSPNGETGTVIFREDDQGG